MRNLAIAAVLMIVAAACGDTATTTAPTAAPPTTGPPATSAPTTSTVVATTALPPTTTLPVTTTAAITTTTTTTMPGEAEFAITQVVFGENGYVAITNVGAGAGDVAGFWLCNRPSYVELPSVVLEPGQFVWVATGDGAALDASAAGAVAVTPANGRIGRFANTGGEIALYAGNSFADATAIRDFVEWGPPGGLPRAGRGSVAVEAGIWNAGDIVEVPTDAIGIAATSIPSAGESDWTGDLGG